LEFTMTAQPARRTLALVTQRDGDAKPPSRRDETIARQWDPEAQLVGALMHLSAAQGDPILKLVPDSAIWRPATRWAMELIRYLVAQNADPDPVTVLHTARRRGPVDAPAHARVGPRRLHLLAVHLADLYTQTVAPQLARQYARQVLEDAFQRAAGDHGTRLTELAESGADRNELAEHIACMRATLADLWRRAEAARRIE
jgi:replicative DNA helicase